MKYTFSFKEINYGSIEIDADHTPGIAEVTDAIMNGGAFFKDTEYEDIHLEETERIKPPKERGYER